MDESYQLRSLTDGEVSTWTEFCADCFSYKPNPPPATYFERHFNNDPRRDSSLIRVIFFSELERERNIIVSSVRVFQRTISIGNGRTLEAGGIGEVCTAEQHRKRGLAKKLLMNAIDTMSNERKMQCSLLHASPALTPVYQRSADYVCVNSKWSILTIKMKELIKFDLTSTETEQVRLASFPDDTDRLQEIHKNYSENRFAGCIIRTTEYWNEYVKFEIGETLYVLTNKKTIIGWISIRPRNGRFQLRDFGVDLDQSTTIDITTAQVLSKLLQTALVKENVSNDQTIELQIPTSILQEMKDQNDFCEDICAWVDWSVPIRNDDDIGWMYKMFCQDDDDTIDMVEIVNNLDTPHLIWPTDSF